MTEKIEEQTDQDGGLAVSVGLKLVQSIMFVYDFITFPLYFAIQQPWKNTEAMATIRANPVNKTKTSITFKPIEKTCPELEAFKAAGIETMHECFNFAVKLHSHKRMVGTRKLLAKSNEEQPNGKVFEKWEMGEYEWQSYLQVDEMANNFGKGLRELGLNPMERICIFAETKADWLVCALGCFKQTFPLVTLYANLGDDAIVHGVNETEVSSKKAIYISKDYFKNYILENVT